MRIVDVRQLFPEGKKLNAIYMQIEQPMVVYHSNEEFIANEMNVPDKTINVIRSFGEYGDFLQKNKIDTTYSPSRKYVDMRPFNIWVRTVDRFIPEYADLSGVIYYKSVKEGDEYKFVSTDAVYIKLYFITPTTTRHIFYTSSGIHSVGMTKWDMTGAVRATFLQEKDERHGKDKNILYKERLYKVISKRQTTVDFIKVANLLFNPATDSFMDFDHAMKQVFGARVKPEDRELILKSKGFQMAIQQTLRTIFPGLAKAMKDSHSPEAMANYLAEAMSLAKEEKNVDKMLKVFDKIKETGYEETVTVSDFTPQLPMVGQLAPQANRDELPSSMPDIRKMEETAISETEDAMGELKDDLDYPDGYVFDMEEEDGE
jgi:hypothetical protein